MIIDVKLAKNINFLINIVMINVKFYSLLFNNGYGKIITI